MAQVNVTISGKSYRIACEDGQEDHLRTLASKLDQSIVQLRERFGEIGDQRLTVMAAITLEDRIQELEQRLEALQDEIAALNGARATAAEQQAAHRGEMVDAIVSIAERIETIAGHIAERADGRQK